MKIIHCNSADCGGGAARAMMRLHSALDGAGIETRVRVRIKASENANIIGPADRMGKALGLVRPAFGRVLENLLGVTEGPYRSFNLLPSGLARELNSSDADLVHLHWLGDECMSIADIGAIRKPVVWTLHDMWAFCGSEHLADDGPDARWRNGYSGAASGSMSTSIDLDRLVWKRKRKYWKAARQVIAPSHWLAACARGSALMADWPIDVIPNVLPTDIFRPLDRSACRQLIGIADAVPLVMFSAHNAIDDRNKGWDLLEPALQSAAAMVPGLECVIVGAERPTAFREPRFPIHWLGRIHDERLLPVIYGAADVVAVPSRCENLPQVATEAQACGRPVVAFATSGLNDVVADGVTGHLATPYSSAELGAAISSLLGDRAKALAFSLAATERANELWSPSAVIPKMLQIYGNVLQRHARGMPG